MGDADLPDLMPSVTLVITRGLPASGKTTRAKAWLPAGQHRARVNRDDLREHTFGLSMQPGDAVLDAAGEDVVTAVQEAAVRALLLAGWSVVVDDTNLRDDFVAAWRDLAAACGAEVEVWDLRDVPVEECVRRDAARAAAGRRSVGEAMIRRIAAAGAPSWVA